MDCALQLGKSNALMSYTVAASTVFNSMSEKLYSAEREVPIVFILYFSRQKYGLYNYIVMCMFVLSVSVSY